MSNLDGIVATLDEGLLPGLNFSLSNHQAAGYVRERNFSTYYPSGSNVYSPSTGQRVIRVLVSDGGKSMLDLSSVRLSFDITNTHAANALYLAGGHLGCLFQRLTLRIAGTQCEDILFYNRLCGMLNQFRSVNSQHSAHLGGVGTSGNQVTLRTDRIIPEGIPGATAGNTVRRVVIDLPCGLFHSHYLLPIGRFPLELTLELAAADAVAMRGPIKIDESGTGGGDVNCSQEYTISNVRLLADTVSLDGAMNDNIDEALLQGKPLTLAHSSWSNQLFPLTGIGNNNASWSVLINRSFSRLQSVFMNFLPSFAAFPVREWNQSNFFACWHGGVDPALCQNAGPVPYNYTADANFRFTLQAGPRLWPSTPMSSLGEAYYQLQKAVGQLISETGLALGPYYRTRSFHQASDLEKAASTASSAGVTMSGLNTRASNDQIRLEWQGVNSDTTCAYTPGGW
jgi:hypothetical protein